MTDIDQPAKLVKVKDTQESLGCRPNYSTMLYCPECEELVDWLDYCIDKPCADFCQEINQ